MPTLYQRTHQLLCDSGFFDSPRGLRAHFITPELSPWRNDLPQADTVADRVQQTMAYLLTKPNGLLLLLEHLQGTLEPADSLQAEMGQLITELRRDLPRLQRELTAAQSDQPPAGGITATLNLQGADLSHSQRVEIVGVKQDYSTHHPTPVKPTESPALLVEEARLTLMAYSWPNLVMLCYDNFPAVYRRWQRRPAQTELVDMLLAHCQRTGQLTRLLS